MTEFVPDYTRKAKREKVYSELHVSGRGKAKGKPDRFSISFRIVKEAIEKDEAYEEVTKNTAALMKILKKWAHEDDSVTCDTISVYSFRAYEAYGRWRKGEIITRVSSAVHVVSPRVDDVSKLIDLGMKSGVCETYGADFFLSDEEKLELRAKALETAVQAAQFDAAHTAQALGIIILGSKSVDVSSDWDGYYDIDDDSMLKCSKSITDSSETERSNFIEPDDVEVSASVRITFVYDDRYAHNAAAALDE